MPIGVGKKDMWRLPQERGAILGLALSRKADEEHLLPAYAIFAQEARAIHPDYQPETVNIDGWKATQNAFVSFIHQHYSHSVFSPWLYFNPGPFEKRASIASSTMGGLSQ